MTAPASTPAHPLRDPARLHPLRRPHRPDQGHLRRGAAQAAGQPLRLQPARPVRQGAQGRHRLPHRRHPPGRRGRRGQAPLAPALPGAVARRHDLAALPRRAGRHRPGPDPRRPRHAGRPTRQDQPPLRRTARRRPRRGDPAALRRDPAERGGGARHPAPDGPAHGRGPPARRAGPGRRPARPGSPHARPAPSRTRSNAGWPARPPPSAPSGPPPLNPPAPPGPPPPTQPQQGRAHGFGRAAGSTGASARDGADGRGGRVHGRGAKRASGLASVPANCSAADGSARSTICWLLRSCSRLRQDSANSGGEQVVPRELVGQVRHAVAGSRRRTRRPSARSRPRRARPR